MVAAIQELHRRRESLMQTQVSNALKIAALRLFGSWRAARAIAVPAFAGGNERWTKRKVLRALRELHGRWPRRDPLGDQRDSLGSADP